MVFWKIISPYFFDEKVGAVLRPLQVCLLDKSRKFDVSVMKSSIETVELIFISKRDLRVPVILDSRVVLAVDRVLAF